MTVPTRPACPARPAADPCRRHALARLAALGAAPLLGACSPAGAYEPPPLPRSPRVATLEVVDRDSGRVLPVHGKDGRAWVAGRPGARYALRVQNLASRRVLLVVSVDGVNVVSGETAALDQAGYVLEPGERYDITGWRKSSRQVAAFEFAPLADSYAARTGRPGDVGVIGLAAFVERPAPPRPALSQAAPGLSRRADAAAEAGAAPAPAAAPSPSAMARDAAKASAASRLGTGHGAREWSQVGQTHFERASATPDQLLQIEYDSAERLMAAGIIPAPRPLPPRPSPFPAQAGFVPDPPPRW